MAKKKRKTRKEKVRSSQRKTNRKTDVVKQTKRNEDILIVEEKFIRQDIAKTVIISIVFTAILIGIWMWLR